MCLGLPVELVEGCPLIFVHVPFADEPQDFPCSERPHFMWAQFWRDISRIEQEEELKEYEDCYLEFQDLIENDYIT